jgi:hypothetical protein
MTAPASPPAESVATVPYGGPVTSIGAETVRAPLTAQSVARGVGRAALWVGVRAAVWLLVKAILKGVAKG